MNAKKDYRKLGFKCGLEIHQQVAGHKLFCSCPAIVRGDKKDFEIKRILRSSAGETGKTDVASEFEMKKEKLMIYTGDSTDVCLVQLDEDPPHKISRSALDTALQVAKMFNAKIVDEIHFMRKTISNGSVVSGFQRTALIATNGFIETSKGNVRIDQLFLEEEAAQKIKETEDSVTWNLDRLGIALIEVKTDASIKDPEQAKETAEKIGMILRSTGKVIRGIGSIRQDVNVSIEGHPRIELKGFQDLRNIIKTIDIEIDRQLNEIEKCAKCESHVRNSLPDGSSEFLRPMPGAARMYPETDVAPIKPRNYLLDIKSVELIDEKIKKLEKAGLSKDLSKFISTAGKADLFLAFVSKFSNIKPAFIAETMIPALTEIRRKHNVETDKITDDVLDKIFNSLNNEEISKDSVIEILVSVCRGSNVDSVLIKYKLMSDNDLENEIKHIVKESREVPFNALIGTVMGKLRGRADGKKIVEMLKKYYG